MNDLKDKIPNLIENEPLAQYTTLGIGGSAKYFIEITKEEEFKDVLKLVSSLHYPYVIIAGGSDLLISDSGFNGLIIRYNNIGTQLEEGSSVLKVKAGTVLQDLVDLANEQGLMGIEKLAGIPGSVGGAIYGNAGAYGQTISDKITKVRVFDGETEYWMNKDTCTFDYRNSIFKQRKNIAILEAEFEFDSGTPSDLQKISEETILAREKKYPPGIKCPGSFFKNLLLINLPKEIVDIAPKDYYGKLPSAWLLDQVGAKGATRGNIKIADYHANLFINEGGGTAEDFFELASEWKEKVKKRYHVELEPEVQLIGFDKEL